MLYGDEKPFQVGGRTKYALCGFGVCHNGFAALMRINKKRAPGIEFLCLN